MDVMSLRASVVLPEPEQHDVSLAPGRRRLHSCRLAEWAMRSGAGPPLPTVSLSV
jgi:hypothetical protein